MKRFGFLLLLVLAVSLTTAKVWAEGDDDDHHYKANAVEMSVIGLAAASVTGASVYLARRRRR